MTYTDVRSRLSSPTRSNIDLPRDDYLPQVQYGDDYYLAPHAEFSENNSQCSSAQSSPGRSMSSHTSYETTPSGMGYPGSSGNIGQQSLYSRLDYRVYSENPTTLGQTGYDATPGSPVHLSTLNQLSNHTVPGSPGNPPAPTYLSSQVTPSGAGHPSAHNQQYDYALPGNSSYPNSPNQQHSHSGRSAVNVHHSLGLGRTGYGMVPGGPGHPPSPNQQRHQVVQRGASDHSKPLNESLYAAAAYPTDPLTPRHFATGYPGRKPKAGVLVVEWHRMI